MPEIILKDKQGNIRGYSNVDTIAVKDTDDNTVEYNNISTRKLVVNANDTYIAPSGIAYDEVEVNVPTTVVESLSAIENKTYTAPEGKAYNPVTVNVPVPPNKFDSLVDRSITTITAEDLAGVTSIGNYAFHNCTSLSSVIIPDSVTRIGDSAFGECSSLTSVTIPNSVTRIGDYAFYFTPLPSITIPNSVTSIGTSAFSGCGSLLLFTCLPTIPPILGGYIFSNCPADMTIYVPADSVDTYKAASGWSIRASYIQAIPNS